MFSRFYRPPALGLPRFCRKAAPFGGLVGQKKIILASLRYFLLPSLAQKGNPRPLPVKSGKTIQSPMKKGVRH